MRKLLSACLLTVLPIVVGADTLVVPGVTPNSTGACTSSNFFSSLSIAADGTLTKTCTQPADVTGNAATATAFAANPSDCASNTFANTIAASGNLTCTAVSEPAFSFTDIVTNNASASAHGLLPKLSNTSTEYLSGTGVFSTPAGTGANTALSNLASVAINTTLLPSASGVDAGSTTKPFRDVYLCGSGCTFGTGYMKLTNSSVTTGNPVINFPASATGTFNVAIIEASQSYTGNNSFGASTTQTFAGQATVNSNKSLHFGTAADGTVAAFFFDTALTPDSMTVLTGSLSNSMMLREFADAAYDANNGPCGTSACTDPTWIIESHNQTTTEWFAFNYDTTNSVGSIDVGAGGVAVKDPLYWIPNIEVVTASKTTTLIESGETYTNTGDADGLIITLLNNPTVGAWWTFAVTSTVTSNTFSIVPSAGESIQFGASNCATSLTATAIGATVTLRATIGGSGGLFEAIASTGVWICV